MLTGKNPYYLEPGTQIRDERPEINLELNDLVQNMLEEDPRKRPWDGEKLLIRLLQMEQTLESQKKRQAERHQEEEEKQQQERKMQEDQQRQREQKDLEEVQRSRGASSQTKAGGRSQPQAKRE